MERIAISLAGHTNLGKTTLARTLLRRDIGVVEDRPHVTDIADGHRLAGDDAAEILLWDLPGFGDSVKLRQRLEKTGFLGWLAQTFDRFRDRPLWCAQQSLKNAREQADIVLYLADAQADPFVSPEVPAELAALAWTNKPVVLVLNQAGLPDAARDEALIAKWREAMGKDHAPAAAFVLDGWSRCWVQEVQFLRSLEEHLPESKRAAFRRVLDGWVEQTHNTAFRASMEHLARGLAGLACDRVAVEESWLDILMAKMHGKNTPQTEEAREKLARALVDRSRADMEKLLAIHGLEGVPREKVESIIKELQTKEPGAPPELWALLGGIGSGALGGLAADFKSGGLTFGGGAVLGAILGGLGAYALGQGYRKLKRDGQTVVEWGPEFKRDEWRAAAMRYLHVAHLGRGRGRWQEPLPDEQPALWQDKIDEWMTRHESEIEAALDPEKTDETKIAILLTRMMDEILAGLYPGWK
jgi:hypothetical protein